MKQLKDWNKQALKMREEGYKSRAIAEKLLGKQSSKSSVNYFFNDYDNGLYGNTLETPKKRTSYPYMGFGIFSFRRVFLSYRSAKIFR